MKRIDRFAWLLDASIPIPGTPYRIGLDPLLGLIPGVGDFLGMILSLYFLAEALHLQLPARKVLQILFWIVLDGVVGLIPILGDFFDFALKSNLKILKILRAEARAR